MKRKPPISTIRLVLHESGYRCANPTCRTILTLDVHHIEYVSEGGTNDATNLLPLCPNCHALHHKGAIPKDSVRAWKMMLITLNEGFDHGAVNTLLALHKLDDIKVSGDGVLQCASLIASGFVEVEKRHNLSGGGFFPGPVSDYIVTLSDKGRLIVEAWKRGDQEAAVNAGISLKPSA
ncbi:MAG: HNH endonuclease signature motif containing protein [Bryobacteraceae bacterium]